MVEATNQTECMHFFVEFDHEIVCQFCGLVENENRLVDEPMRIKSLHCNEHYTNQQNEVNWFFIGNRTVIDRNDCRKYANSQDLMRLSRHNTNSVNHERGMKRIFDFLQVICSQLTISYTTRMTAWKIAKYCVEVGYVKGRTMEGSGIAALLIAGRLCKQLTEIPFETYSVSKKSVNHTRYLMIRDILPKLHMKYPVAEIDSILQRMMIKLDISSNYFAKALKICQYLQKSNHFRKQVLIAGVLYWVSTKYHLKFIQKTIAKACGVSEISLRNAFNFVYQNLQKFSKINFPMSQTRKKAHNIQGGTKR